MWLQIYLILNPLQVGVDVVLQVLAVTHLGCEGPTVVDQGVHPVLVN